MSDLKHLDNLGLTEKQKMFIYFYCHPDYNYHATRAYARAYDKDLEKDYSVCAERASKLLKQTNIQDGVDKQRSKFLKQQDTIAAGIFKEWYNMASTDLTDFYEEIGSFTGKITDLKQLPKHLRACIKSIKHSDNGCEITLYDKQKALDSLAKSFGLFVEKRQEIGGDYESIIDRLSREDKNNE